MKKSTLVAIFIMAFFFLVSNTVVLGQTYTWQGTDNAAWTDALNWNPTRTTPSPTDILQFNDGTTKTVTAVPTETIGQLLISNNTVINLQANAAITLTIAGLAGTDLDIPAGCGINLNAVNAISITLPAGSTGSVSGEIAFTSTASTAHRLIGVDAGAITFNSGSTFTAGTFFSGNPFGATNLNSVIFGLGSTYIAKAGSNPFGATQPASVVVFQTGSLFKIMANLTPSFSGRSYADIEIDAPTFTLIPTGGSAVSMDNLTITNGTLNFNVTATPGHSIKGNISIAAGAVLNFTPASAGMVNLNGGVSQTITNNGTLTFGANSSMVINNTAGVSVINPVSFNNLTLTNGIVTNGANLLTVKGNINGGSATSYIDGKLATLFSTASSKLFPIGKGGNYRPVTINYTALDAPSTVIAEQTETALSGTLPSNTSLFSDRFWTLSQTGSNVFSYDITLDGIGFAPTGTAVILKNDAGTITSLTASTPSYTATGLTSFSEFGLGDYNLPTIVAPVIQSSDVLFSSVAGNSLTTSWTNGDGTNRIVLINTSNSFSTPVDGTDPTADTAYSGTGEQVIYNGSGNSVSVSGLNNSIEYWFRVFEYNGTALTTKFSTADGINNPASQVTSTATICGTKTVGIGGDYTTLTAAISDLNTKDLCGAVNLTLTDATYPDETFPLVINFNAGSSSVNTITIKPASGNSPVIICNTYKSAFILNGSDYVIIDGSNQVGGISKDLTISNTYTGSTSNSIINLEDNGVKSASNSTIMNCIIGGMPSVSSSFGIYLNDDLGRNFENTSILNNTIKNTRIGIRISDANNNIISSNIIGNETEPIKQGGIEISYCDNNLISNNDIFGETSGNPNAYQYGLFVGPFSTNSKIIKNKIHDFYYTGSSGVACWGIYYKAGANSLSEISNNLIYNIKSDGDTVAGGTKYANFIPAGISIISGGNLQIYYNSINMTGKVLGTGAFSNFAGNSTCLLINSNVSNMDIKNNIFKNSMTTESGTGTNKTYGLVSYSENTVFSDINYNDYFIDGLNPYVGFLSGEEQTIADWQAATSKDGNSISSDPGFVSDTDLHPSLVGPNNKGITIAGITNDFSEKNRSSTPDIGAYEFSLLPKIVTDAATNISVTSVQLNGTVNANNDSTFISFEWGLTSTYGNIIASNPDTLSSGSATAVIASLSGLNENTSYHFRCVGINTTGTIYGDDQSFITQCSLPSDAGSISGSSSVCQAAKEVAYSVEAIPNSTYYIWTLPLGFTIVKGDSTNSIMVNLSEGAETGLITVQGVNACGNGVSSGYDVVVNPIPSTPVVSQVGNTLSSDALTGNQWYLNGSIISDAVAQTYEAVTDGDYSVVVTLSGCSSEISNVVSMVITGIATNMFVQNINTFPNPSHGNLTLSVTSASPETFDLRILNSIGVSVYNQKRLLVDGTLNKVIDISTLPQGVYSLVLNSSNNHQLIRKIVIK